MYRYLDEAEQLNKLESHKCSGCFHHCALFNTSTDPTQGIKDMHISILGQYVCIGVVGWPQDTHRCFTKLPGCLSTLNGGRSLHVLFSHTGFQRLTSVPIAFVQLFIVTLRDPHVYAILNLFLTLYLYKHGEYCVFLG